MKKWKMSIIAALLLLTGCQTSDQQAPVLTLSKSRVQVALNEKIDYSTYILKAVDDVDGDLTDQVTHSEIDTTSVGKKVIHYYVEDQSGNQSQQDLTVDVVEYVGDLINPITAQADTVENPEDVTVLVNKLHEIPEGWKPDGNSLLLEPTIT